MNKNFKNKIVINFKFKELDGKTIASFTRLKKNL